MRKVLMFGLAAVLLAAAPALAEEGPGTFFEKGKALFAQEKYEEAFKAFDVVSREWPDDPEFTPRALVMGGECLLRLGRIEDALHRLETARERCGEKPDLAQHAGKLLGKARAMLAERRGGEGKEPRDRPPREGPPPEERVARHLAEVERKLREKGLAGEELERALAEEKERIHRKTPPPGNPEEKLERMMRLWREEGVPQEEIDARVRRFKEEQTRFERARAEFEEARRRMEEEGVPPEEMKRRLGEMERRRKEVAERGWREGREGELDQARRDFLKLAERLGIPPAEAERLLAEHARRRLALPEGGPRPEGRPGRPGDEAGEPRPEGRPPMGGGEDRLRMLEERLSRLERAVHELLERLERR